MLVLLAQLRVSTDFSPLSEACCGTGWENEQSDRQLTQQPQDCHTCLRLICFFLSWREVLNLQHRGQAKGELRKQGAMSTSVTSYLPAYWSGIVGKLKGSMHRGSCVYEL